MIRIWPFSQRACLVRALMSQAVLWGIKNGRRATKILMNDFFSIPLHLAKKKNFFRPPLGGAALLGGGGKSTFWGGLMTSDQNETFHSKAAPLGGGVEKNFFFAKISGIA